MLQLYDVNHNKIVGITNYKDFNIQREINKLDTLSFLIPINDPNYNLIHEECYISTQTDEYVVKEINYSDADYDEIVCEINIEGIKGTPVSNFETVEQKCADAANLALASTGWTVGACDVTKLRTTKKSNCTAYDVLQEIQTTYNCEMAFDTINKKVNIYQVMGEDKGTYFTEQLNLKKIDVQRNTHDYITRIIPIGKDNLNITSVNAGGKNYVENYQYSDKALTSYWEDNRYTVAQDLLDDAAERLDYLSKPYKAYNTDIIDLANISLKYKNVLDYGLGDSITLLSKSRNVKEKQRIVKMKVYPDEPEKNTAELANKIQTVNDLITRFDDTSDTVDSVTNSDGTVDGSKVDGIDWDNIQHVHIDMADIENLSATIANIGNLNASQGNITVLNSANANIKNLISDKADISDLTAATGRISVLESDAASIKNELAGHIGADNLEAGAIQAGSEVIANGAIGSEQINDLDVDKLNAGDFSTTKFKIVGSNGRLTIQDNRFQIFDTDSSGSLFERICIGNVNGDGTEYGMRVRGKDGTTLLYDENGQTKEGFTDGYSKLDNNSLDPSKIDIEKAVTMINGATTQIQSSKVEINNTSLDTAFSNISNTVTSQGQTINNQSAEIQANTSAISAKLDTQTFASYKTTNDNNISSINSSLDKNTTDISILQGEISTKVSSIDVQTAINNVQIGGRNLAQNTLFNNMSQQDTTVTYGGHPSFKQINSGKTSNAWSGFEIQYSPAQAGEIYTASLYSYTDATTSFDLGSSMEIRYYDSTGARIIQSAKSITPSANATWTYYTLTGTCPANTVRVSIVAYVTKNGREWWALPKLEKGNKATDWSPAPEDITQDATSQSKAYADAQIAGVNGTISTMETNINNQNTEIDQLKNSISLKVDTSTFDTQVASLNTDINGLPTNGKNLILNSDFSQGIKTHFTFQEWRNAGAVTYSQNLASQYILGTITPYMRATGLQNTDVGGVMSSEFVNIQPNTTYTLQYLEQLFRGIVAHESAVFDSSNNIINLIPRFASKITGVTFSDDNESNTGDEPNSQFRLVTMTFTTPSNASKFRFQMTLQHSYNDAFVFIDNIKLEKGNKATDWSPAPEDVQSQIDSTTSRLTTAEGNINVMGGEITQRVSKTDLVTLTQNLVKTNPNLFPNGSFEDGLPSLQNLAPSNATVSNNFIGSQDAGLAASTGSKVLFIQDPARATQLSFTFPYQITVKANTKYTLSYDSIWMGYADSLKTLTSIFCYKSNGAVSAMPQVQLYDFGNYANQFKHFTKTFTTPTDCTMIKIQMGVAATEATFVVDSIKLEEGSIETGWCNNPNDKWQFSVATSQTEVTQESYMDILAGLISSKVSKDGVESLVQQSPEQFLVAFNNATSEGDVIVQNGNITMQNGQGEKDCVLNFNTANYGQTSSARIISYTDEQALGNLFIEPESKLILRSLNSGSTNVHIQFSVFGDEILEGAMHFTDSIGLIFNPPQNDELRVLNGQGGWGYIACRTIACTGGKPALVDTKDYGQTYLWAEESTHITFNDDGIGQLDASGKCYVYLDPRYLETVSTKECDYFISLTGFKGANVEIEDIQPTYFVASGTPNLKFTWEVKAERKGYERLRFNDCNLDV